MRLILHIGRPKTGTTSLQEFLYHNRDALSSAGFLLFDNVGSPNNVDLPAYFARKDKDGLARWCHRRGLKSLIDKEVYFETRGFLESIDEQIGLGSAHHHTAIITSEKFVSFLDSPEEVEDLAGWVLSRFESVTVVCWVRKQVDLLASAWSTSVRAGYPPSFRGFVNAAVRRGEPNYLVEADRWSSYLGRENLYHHLYRGGSDWDIRRFFVDTYLGEIQGLVFPQARANVSFTALEAQLVRIVNSKVQFWLPDLGRRNPQNLMWRKRVIKIARRGRRPITLTAGQAQKVQQAFAESNRLFSERYLPPGEAL